MMVDYHNLWHLLIDKDMSKAQLKKAVGISTRTFAKLSKGEPVTMSTLTKICDVLHCELNQIVNCKPGIGNEE